MQLIQHEVASTPRIIQHGVKHGSIIAPLLFNIYFLPIADILYRHHIYADDTLLCAACPPSSYANSQRKIDECVSMPNTPFHCRQHFVLWTPIHFSRCYLSVSVNSLEQNSTLEINVQK